MSVSKGTKEAEGDANINPCVDEAEHDEDEPELDVGVNEKQLAIVFLRWLRLQVTHFVALHVLSNFCARNPDPSAYLEGLTLTVSNATARCES